MYSQAVSKKTKFLGGASDFQKPEGSVWEEFENARKAISHGRATQLPECAPRVLKQNLTLKRGCWPCGHHLEIPVNFVSEFVFCKWNLLGRWRMCGQLRASPVVLPPGLPGHDLSYLLPLTPATLPHCSATCCCPRVGWLGPHSGGCGADQDPVTDWICPL